jgi:CRISPR-associated protein (TIGR03984 family)
MNALVTFRRQAVNLADALGAFPAGSTNAVALVYTPRWCGFARLDNGQLLDHTGKVPESAYEVRVFDGRAELRWLNDPTANGTGTATLLTVEAGLPCPPDWKPVERDDKEKLSVIDTNKLTYLLWGEHAHASKSLPDGWSQLGLARIGALPVPLKGLAEKQRVLLNAVEYIAEDKFGSAFVCEELLTGLVIQKESGNG